jgi:hypothetical protein
MMLNRFFFLLKRTQTYLGVLKNISYMVNEKIDEILLEEVKERLLISVLPILHEI